jgi:DNA-binding NtrC family response regulator
MPGLNGADLIAQAVQIRPSLKALVITGYPNVDGLSDLPAGITVLAKPFRRDALVAAVESLVGTGSDQNLTASVFERVAE